MPPISEADLVLGQAKRPSMHPRLGDDVIVHYRAGIDTHYAKVRRLVAFTRSWTSLELASFTVETDVAGELKVWPVQDEDGRWIEDTRGER